MKNINYQSRFTPYISDNEWLKREPLQVIDVGARGGPQSHWPLYKGSINVIGFEPYDEECRALNAMAAEGKFPVPFTCYPVALGETNTTARLYEHINKAGNCLTPETSITGFQQKYTDIPLRRFDDFAAEHFIDRVDFMKIDVEGHEPQVIKGLGKFLGKGGILGFEIEVHFYLYDEKPPFSDIESLMRAHGYQVYDLDIFRFSSAALPSPAAWDHRDHNNKPIFGPTLSGRVGHGDALFLKDIRPEKEEILRTKNVARILKLATLFEVYGLPDCALDLLEEYSEIIEPVVNMEDVRNALVPDHYGEGITYQQYLATYQKHVGRVPKKMFKAISIKHVFKNARALLINKLAAWPRLYKLAYNIKHSLFSPSR